MTAPLKMHPMLCFMLAICIFTSTAFADELASSPTDSNQGSHQSGERVQMNMNYFTGYAADFNTIVTSPARWDGPDWLTAAIVTGISAELYDNDAKIQKWVLDHKTTTTGSVGDKVTLLGHGGLTPVVLGGMYLYGHVVQDEKIRETVLLSVESFVITGAFVQALKFSTHRHRPYTNDPPHTWDGASLKNNGSNLSFPSGHASSAFAVATVIAEEYNNAVVPPLAYTIAAITAFNRVSRNAHWSSDVFAGSAIGYFTGKTIVGNHRNSKGTTVSVTPLLLEGGSGMVLTYQF